MRKPVEGVEAKHEFDSGVTEADYSWFIAVRSPFTRAPYSSRV